MKSRIPKGCGFFLFAESSCDLRKQHRKSACET